MLRDPREHRVLVEFRDSMDLRDLRDLREHRVLVVSRDSMDLRASEEIRVLKAMLELME